MSDLHDKWGVALPTETKFWEKVITGEFEQYNASLRKRCTGETPFPSHLTELLADNKTTRILDVGAGPHTVIGSASAPSPIEIVAIDPLADDYARLLNESGITPAVPTVFGEAERLNEYGLGTFDLVYSRNALDHSYDPVKAIGAMLDVIDDDGAIYLEGSVNEGEKQKYGGLHQWNFQPTNDGDLVVWRQDSRHSLRQFFGAKAKVSSDASSDNWYKVVIRKS